MASATGIFKESSFKNLESTRITLEIQRENLISLNSNKISEGEINISYNYARNILIKKIALKISSKERNNLVKNFLNWANKVNQMNNSEKENLIKNIFSLIGLLLCWVVKI